MAHPFAAPRLRHQQSQSQLFPIAEADSEGDSSTRTTCVPRLTSQSDIIREEHDFDSPRPATWEGRACFQIRESPFALVLIGPDLVSSDFIGVEIWEGDERRKFQAIESGDSQNGRNLFTELSFLRNSLPRPSFTECLALIQ